jgi:hypothetical protein
MDWVGHVAHMGANSNAHGILVGKSAGARPLGIIVSRWIIILKWILEEKHRME